MTSTKPPTDIIDRLHRDQPAFHSGGTLRWYSLPETLGAIRASVRPGYSSIETGTGASTVVFAASGADHTAISPDPDEHQRIREYCQSIGVDDGRLTFIAERSEDVLPHLLGAERTLDAAFIDGAHSFPFPEVDWCYISRALKIGGSIVLDDITIPSVNPVFRHMAREHNWRFDRVLDERAAAFTLLAAPAEDDNWLAQAMNDRYPDFSYAPLPDRIRLTAAFKIDATGRSIARRSPRLRRAYKTFRRER
jgi:predicted O-methyltransferase YrrM